ncbi:NAD(P)H-hydrate dehydratase [Autumnicola musiva]|uniref:Bifunctional NAD(P)H-hydrate repair enzyme n=1 Tax=Autumnicola musiva TaxID=3075589 RepID=A0ABU3D5S1_9FLAO|nr:NAD(P)H-hydrate dehydratase [Zunongwangia sp. F117]MDT0676888.1 NAD(P)H-hydrate dehydratase [Zunongwangia sp. F117]
MKIFSASQLKEADEITIKNQNITSEELMERAATTVFHEIHRRLQGAAISVKIFCGIGNNGGDGLAISRMLIEHGYQVKVFIVNYSEKRSEDFLANYDRIKNVTRQWPELIKKEEDFPDLNKGEFVIDAIFGIGLNRPIEGWMARLINHINNSDAFVLAVDMPSGLFPDRIPGKNDAVINADFTLTFQSPKLVFFLPQTMDFVGDMQVLDIGLDQNYLAETTTDIQLIRKAEAHQLYNPRKKNSHKGSYGHALTIGGSYGKIGSILLTSTAVLRTGAGLCTVFVPKCGYNVIQTGLPEAMVITDENFEMLTNIKTGLDADVICFGVGIGTSEETVGAFKELLENTTKPMLIDADGLNILSKNNDLLELLPENSVLTPHPKELQRLIGEWNDDFQKIDMVRKFCRQYKLIIVLKGAYTFTFDENNMYINTTGNPGMATAGSGDVLSGVITSLLSQKYDPLIAAVLGVYLHGRSGDIYAEEQSYEGLISGDIADNMGRAYNDLLRSNNSENDK